jgi:hypothetical protein
MPYRGRDTHYLEWLVVSLCMSMGIVSYFTALWGHSDRLLFEFLAPAWLWSGTWWLCGGWMAWGSYFNERSKIQHAAGVITVLWFVVTIKAWGNFQGFPMTSGVAPVITFFSGCIYVYQHRIMETQARNGKPPRSYLPHSA